MTITCAIVDDEPLASGLLASYAEKTPYLELKGTYHNAIDAMKDLRIHPVQLVFLDIQMPELNGIEFAKILPKETKIVITTAFPQYAIEGYKVSAIDYLLKPITYEAFLSAADKSLEWFGLSEMQDGFRNDRVVFIKSDYKLQRICLDDVIYIESEKDYVLIHLKDGTDVNTLMSLRKLESVLPHPEFLRTHRSYIVRMPEVVTIDRLRIIFANGDSVPISDLYKDDIFSYLNLHTLG